MHVPPLVWILLGLVALFIVVRIFMPRAESQVKRIEEKERLPASLQGLPSGRPSGRPSQATGTEKDTTSPRKG